MFAPVPAPKCKRKSRTRQAPRSGSGSILIRKGGRSRSRQRALILALDSFRALADGVAQLGGAFILLVGNGLVQLLLERGLDAVGFAERGFNLAQVLYHAVLVHLLVSV